MSFRGLGEKNYLCKWDIINRVSRSVSRHVTKKKEKERRERERERAPERERARESEREEQRGEVRNKKKNNGEEAEGGRSILLHGSCFHHFFLLKTGKEIVLGNVGEKHDI